MDKATRLNYLKDKVKRAEAEYALALKPSQVHNTYTKLRIAKEEYEKELKGGQNGTINENN